MAPEFDPSTRRHRSSDPLVLLPGMLGSASLWRGAFADASAERVLLARIDTHDTIGALADAVLRDAPERFAIAGHSLGGVVALEIARRAPTRVTRLGLLNCSARAPSAAQRAGWQTMADSVRAGGFARIVSGFSEAMLPPAARSDRALQASIAAMAHDVGPAGLARQLNAQLHREDYLGTLATLRQRALVVSGSLDDVSPPALQAEMAAALPDATHLTIDGCGHMTPLEAPAVVRAHLRDLIAG